MAEKLKKSDLVNVVTLVFLVGCIIGTYYEQILTLCIHLFRDGTIVWVSRRGLIYGPLSPIYGIGAVLILFFFCLKKKSKLKTFVYGSLLGGVYEYGASLFQEKVFGSISWDYSKRFLNIGGRTTIPYMILWGFLVIIFVYYMYPLLLKIYFKMKPKVANIVFKTLLIFLVFDILISIIAVGRQTLRHRAVEAKTIIGEFCDKHYNDEYLKKIYENTKFIE